MKFTRITVDPARMGGVPTIRGRRIPVATVVGMIAEGMSVEEILRDYPDLEKEDIREALTQVLQRTGHDDGNPDRRRPGHRGVAPGAIR